MMLAAQLFLVLMTLSRACLAKSWSGLPSTLPISLKPLLTNDRTFVDADGRQRFFHGVNTVVKGPPYVPWTASFHPSYSLADRDFIILSQAGMNVIRLGVMWPGVEPLRGWYNESYLDEIEKIVVMAAKYGVYTLLDMHQDDLSEHFCGEGIPLWAVKSHSEIFPFPSPAGAAFNASSDYESSTNYSLPTKQACNRHDWPLYQASTAANVAYEDLYTDPDLLQRWSLMWQHVAARFAPSSSSSFPSLLGLELLNEPYVGNAFADPLLLIPGVADHQRLQPAYERVAAAIREVDDERIVFFAGVTWDDFGAGFTQSPGGAAYSNRSVFAFHYYEPPQFKNSSHFDFELHVGDARRLSTGKMLTEFGSPAYNANFEVQANNADRFQLSWIMWEWKDFCLETSESSAWPSQFGAFGACKTGYGGVAWNQSSGQPDPHTVKALARSYPLAVAGTMVSFAFDATTAVFTLQYEVDQMYALPTEIFVSEAFYYPDGVSVTIDPASAAVGKHEVGSNLVQIVATEQVLQGQRISVTLSPLAAMDIGVADS